MMRHEHLKFSEIYAEVGTSEAE